MIEIIILAAVLTIIAGLWDLKTTEVPDHLLYAMIAIGIGYWIFNWLITADSLSLIVSLTVGTTLLALGLFMYKKGQWGGADAWIMAAIGYMIPLYNGELFIVPYLLNFVIISVIYTAVYAIIMGLRSPSVFKDFEKDLKAKLIIVLGVPVLLFGIVILTMAVDAYFTPLAVNMLVLFTVLVLFWRYAVVIEAKLFKKRIPTSKLKVGDVLEKGNWVGLTEKQVKRLRKQKHYVVIKDGVRFIPAFAIALVVTLLLGNIFFIIF